MSLTVLVPVYNESGTILQVTDALVKVPGITEIVVIDDGSTDASADTVRQALSKGRIHLPPKTQIKIVSHGQNQGKGSAIRTGLTHATGEIVAIQDADLEYNPEELPFLIEPILKGDADVVFGSRFLKKNPTSHWRFFLGNKVITKIINLFSGGHFTDAYTCYKIMPRETMKALELRSKGFELEAEISMKVVLGGLKTLERPISYAPRSVKDGKKIRFKDAVKGAWVALSLRWAHEALRSRALLVMGGLFILAGLVFNEWTAAALFSPDGIISTHQRAVVCERCRCSKIQSPTHLWIFEQRHRFWGESWVTYLSRHPSP